jgi:hypothetical protein
MGMTEILAQVKDKVLDAAHFELLKHAYELQEENIAQLKTNNESLKESNVLLKEKLERLETANNGLNTVINNLKARLKKLDCASNQNLSDVANSVIQAFLDNDTTEMMKHDLEDPSRLSKIEIAAGLDELKKKHIIIFATSHGKIILTELGKKLLAEYY